jgi:arginyl-tRNA synthetase
VTIREQVESVLRQVVAGQFPTAGGLRFEVSKPRGKSHGDFATNVAMVAAKALGRDPMDLAGRIADALRKVSGSFSAVEVARPGFINISVAPGLHVAKMGEILAAGADACGSSSLGQGRLVQVEFVSANPTGPLNVVSARAAAVGDALVRLLRRVGYDARSEFYVNDAGNQVALLGRSLEARFRQLLGEKAEIPEGCYPGEYLVGIAGEVMELAVWADRQAQAWAGLEEPGPGEEASAVSRFLEDEAGGGHPADETGVYLAEYLEFKASLAAVARSLWAALFVCDLSARPIGSEDVRLRLDCIDRYRRSLRAGQSTAGPSGSSAGTPAARVFLGCGGGAFDFGRFAVERIVEGQRASLEQFGKRPEGGLRFDSWVRESSLRGTVAEVADRLIEDGRFVYERDGALWLRESEQGDAGERAGEGAEEKDEWVIRRRTGEPTYFLADIAYHVDKRRRGFERVIDIWGPDHHGHVGRMKAAVRVANRVLPGLDVGDDWLEIMIAQQVNLMREGKRVQMSKRAGEYVTLDDVVAEVGADAARFFFLMRRSNSHLDFDLDLAKKTSEENPVYYVQYAHARICSILEFARESGLETSRAADLGLLVAAEEIDLVKGLADFDEVVKASALALEPHRVISCLMDLAARFHRFYHNHRVVIDDHDLAAARLALCLATRTVLASGLSLIGVSAPASM